MAPALPKRGAKEFLMVEPRTVPPGGAMEVIVHQTRTDAGGSWSALNLGLLDNGVVEFLAIDPVTPTTLYATGSGVVHRSVDAGNTWSWIGSGGPLAIGPLAPTTLYTAQDEYVSKSTDAGASWKAANNRGLPAGAFTIVIDPITPSTLHVGPSAGECSTSSRFLPAWATAMQGTALPSMRS